MKKLLKILGILLLAVLVLAAGLFGVLTLTEYKPADVETVAVTAGSAPGEALRAGDTLRVVTWNVGYSALGDNADFFMDGGKSVRTADLARVQANMGTMTGALQGMNPDLIFLQEVDVASDRSHRVDESALFRAAFPGMNSAFAANYRALYVPYPVPPIGHVDGGIQTLARPAIADAARIQLPCPFSWPLRLGNLKRCLLVTRIPVEGTGKELVAVNLHLEAYDDGEGKIAQTAQLASFLQAEAEKGNYVLAGGDFNQIFSGADDGAYAVREGLWTPGVIAEEDFGNRFSLLMDTRVPTCRSLDQPLAGADKASFQFYMIDGFIVSDNLTVKTLETQNLGFTATDHNPVLLEVTLGEA